MTNVKLSKYSYLKRRSRWNHSFWQFWIKNFMLRYRTAVNICDKFWNFIPKVRVWVNKSIEYLYHFYTISTLRWFLAKSMHQNSFVRIGTFNIDSYDLLNLIFFSTKGPDRLVPFWPIFQLGWLDKQLVVHETTKSANYLHLLKTSAF